MPNTADSIIIPETIATGSFPILPQEIPQPKPITKSAKTDVSFSANLTDTTDAQTQTHITQKTVVLPEMPLPDSLSSDTGITLVMLFLFFCFCYITLRCKKVLQETVKDFLHLKVRSSIFIEPNVSKRSVRLTLILLFVGCSALFTYITAVYFFNSHNLPFTHASYFGFIAAGIILFFGIKIFVFRILGYVFFNPDITAVFIKDFFHVLSMCGLGLFPLVLLLVYAPEQYHFFLIIAGGVLTVIAILLIIYKIVQIFFNQPVSIPYIILYLCTLEILPILLLLKLFI